MYDIVIRGGTIHDGRGGEPFVGDVAITGEHISHVGPDAGPGRQEIDAAGRIVTPGFIDLHTHYDAQATWDQVLAPSTWHGVTSVVMGNCGVGFAPVRPGQRSEMITIMENVEEIPRRVLEAGLPWDWETFPEYLDALDRFPHAIDIGAQIPHIAVRAYVMGDRAARDEPATEADIAAMAEIVEEGLRAGAVGFSCSRTNFHRMSDGERVPGSMGDRGELIALGKAVGQAGSGVIQCLSDMKPGAEEMAWLEEMSVTSGATVCFSLFQSPVSDKDWRWQLDRIAEERGGARLIGHFSPRAVGNVMQWRAIHPFMGRPSWKAIAGLPWPEQLARLKDPAFRQQMLSEGNDVVGRYAPELEDRMLNGFARQYELGDDLDYEPDPASMSIAVRAAQAGVDPEAYAYDVLMRRDGTGMIYLTMVNYENGNLDHVRELMQHRHTVVSLADSGAHCTRVVDASSPTFVLTHWTRDRRRGEMISLASAIKSYTGDAAECYNLLDRGVIAPGYLADINVIDFGRLQLDRPYLSFDFPEGGCRLMQKAQGYDATIKRGQVIFRDGEHTGALPGRVIRGTQPAPAMA